MNASTVTIHLLWRLQVLESCLKSGALRSAAPVAGGEAQPMHPTIARLQAEDAGSAASRMSSGFGGSEFWASLRQVNGLDADVRALLADARSVLRRRIVLPLMVGHSCACGSFLGCPSRPGSAGWLGVLSGRVPCDRWSRTLRGRGSWWACMAPTHAGKSAS